MTGRGALSRDEIASLRTIGEVAEHLDLPQHVLRFWETRFKEIDPVKRAGGRRFYRPRDIELVESIRHLLYREGYTIKGVQRILSEQGVDAVIADVRRRQSGELPPPAPPVAPAPATPAEPTPAPRPAEPPPFTGPPPFTRQATLDLPEPEVAPIIPEPAPEVPPPEPVPSVEPPNLEESRPEPALAPVPAPTPVFNAPVIVTRRLDQEQAKLLREALAELEECKRLLNLTRR